ncbi:MAG: ATP-dependent RecD-like DNA helicase [Phycisphaerales bacterium]|nr:ATP-dependent RecD-like DNA helicase [Phycisphaerales bacterium]
MNRPLRHISIRVPWHDTAWDGRVCAKPALNGACLRLKGIGLARDDGAEEAVATKSLNILPREQWPCCVGERATFMAPFELVQSKVHPYSWKEDGKHAHFAPTPLRHPPYSAPAVPFSWMLAESAEQLAAEHALDVLPDREPDLGFKTQWLQHRDNQKALSDCFCAHIKPNESLVFFYAKHVPFVEDAGGRRIIIGVGRVLHVGPCVEYEYNTKDLKDKLRSVLWERLVQHSIRPDFKDGFILPYHAALEKAATDPGFDPATIAAFSPEDRLLEFSHASQLVTHDAAIAGLLACADSLRKVKAHLPGKWDHCLQWIDDRLGELWKARGPCPGLGAALSAFGVEQGNFVARAIADKAGENADPWPLVDRAFADPKKHLPEALAEKIGKTMAAKWAKLPAERRALLCLLSRFEITLDQAKLLYVQEERAEAGINSTDADILANPYLLYELTRLSDDPMSIWTVDRGVFPDEVVRNAHPLPEPTALDAGTDARRVRALTVSVLEEAAASGNSLLPQDQVVLRVRDLTLDPPCQVDADLMTVAKEAFGDAVVEVPLATSAPALQLGRLAEMGGVIRTSITKRSGGKRLEVKADWRKLLDAHLATKGAEKPDELEERARVEKTAALKELAESRVSVLIGPAGTGKTTLLSVLCGHPDVAAGDILLLAPTGKARVRMEQSTKDLRLKGYTIAQFLSPDRYDGTTGRYRLSDQPPDDCPRTVIIDEASMLTEEMLAALLQALKGVHRLIFIGDPRQLPPIGTGRPFVDIINHLAPAGITEMFPRVAPGFAELTIRRRQAGEEREDLQLAEWFSGAPIAPGEDDVFDKVIATGESKHVRFVPWETAEELRTALIDTLVDELGLSSPDDIVRFDATLGGVPWNDIRFFNPRRDDTPAGRGAAEISEGWQILSPVRAGAHGVPDLNRLIHETFRSAMVKASTERGHQTPKPKGPEKIVYGDKVINLINTDPAHPRYRHRRVYPAKDKPYIANGEIGMTVGFFWRGRAENTKRYRENLEVEFSSQPGFKYTYTERDFGEEGNPVLELAYALTVHKSQGSEFGTVILVLPNPCRLLSREMLYTALTRQRNRIVILHQGDRAGLRKYSTDDNSETARRLTNIFEAPRPILIEGRIFEEGLIHRSTADIMVRSKSEVIIADHLERLRKDTGVEYAYERPLTIGAVTKYPDFTIEDMESGITVYWEHCGMLHVPSYRQRWEEKLAWYRANGILPYEEGGGDKGTLVVTRDEPNGSIDSAKITKLLTDLF